MKKLFSFFFALALLSACKFSGEPEMHDYTVPSWTLYQRALKSGQTVQEAKALLVSKNFPYNVNTAINGCPTVQMGVAWFTNAGVAGGSVQIVEGRVEKASGFSRARIVPATSVAVDSTPYVSLGNPNRNRNAELIELSGFAAGEKRAYTSNKALLAGLKPNTLYSYRVGKKGAWSDIGSFTTAKAGKEPFEFIYVTDTQAHTDEMFDVSRITVEAAHRHVPDARFLLITGDLIDSSGAESSEWEWEQWFETMQDVWLRLPIAPVQGNHDKSPYNNMFYHFNTDVSFNAQQTDEKAKTAMDGTVYSFVCGDALFLVINFEDMSGGEPYFSALEQWMRRQVVAHSDAKWRIVAYHKAMFTGHARRLAGTEGIVLRSRFVPVFQDLGIDLLIQGHDHMYQVIGVLAADGETVKHLPEAVSDQTFVAPTLADGTQNSTDVTGKQGGTFDTSNGMLFFLNNSAGKKKYYPSSKEQIEAGFPQHGIKDYFDLLNKFGQTGEPTFSRVSVSTDAIDIATYTVSDTGAATLFDRFRIVK